MEKQIKKQWKGHWEERNGIKIFVIEISSEEISYPNGRKDVIIHAPALSLLNQLNLPTGSKIEMKVTEHKKTVKEE